MILKMCSFNSRLCILISWQGKIIVHLQTLLAVPPDLFILIFVLTLAALAAAAAAVFSTVAQGRGQHGVPGCHGVQGPGQKVPAAEDLGQVAGATRLHHIDNDHTDNQRNDGHADADQDLPSGQRQAEYSQRGRQEAQQEVEDGKPAVFGRMVPQPSGQPDGHPREGDWIPQ